MKPDQPSDQTPDYNEPVAYDNQGRPLYAHPPKSPPAPSSPPPAQQYVHMTRATQPMKPEISPEMKERHDKSQQQYPFLNLSDSEYVISAVRRHPIGLFIPVGTTLFLVAMLFVLMFMYSNIADSANSSVPLPGIGATFFLFVALVIGVLMGGFIAVYVYLANKFFLTNESVIQELQTSLFSHHEQTVSLASIEDASYQKHGILQSLLDYGSIRLSTEGDETTYRFKYVARPKQQIAQLNNAVEAFKNGRPVEDHDN